MAHCSAHAVQVMDRGGWHRNRQAEGVEERHSDLPTLAGSGVEHGREVQGPGGVESTFRPRARPGYRVTSLSKVMPRAGVGQAVVLITVRSATTNSGITEKVDENRSTELHVDGP